MMNYYNSNQISVVQGFKKERNKVNGMGGKSVSFFTSILMFAFFLFGMFGIQAQTTLINPAQEGGFNVGNTFASNGWTVANQGVNPSKWVIGTAVSNTTTATTASVVSGTTTLTLTTGNPNIYPGMKVTASSSVLAANTYVSAIAGNALTLSNATTAASGTPVTLTFGFGSNAGAVGSSATVANASSTITLAVANPAIVVGQSISVTSGTAVLAANTYVTNVSGTTITLSQPTIALSSTAVSYSFGATASNISGNAAYVSNNDGISNTAYGYNGNRTLYFYRDVTVSAAEQAMTLTFDVKSPIASTSGWQVWAAPTTQVVEGKDTQVTSAFLNTVTWPGATLVAFNHTSQVGTTKQTAFIPKNFAGTTFRLIFVWTNNTSAMTLPTASFDNISLVSRPATDITSVATGLWSNPAIWDIAVPTPADTVVISANNVVSIDCKYSGATDLFVSGAGATLQWANTGTVLDEFKITNDLGISGSGARFNVYEGGVTLNGKKLFVAHDINITSGGRFDTSSTAYTANMGYLNLNGSTVQTVTVDGTSFIGGTTNITTTSTNQQNVLGQLAITNTSTATPNIIWNANNVRIGGKFLNNTGRIGLGTNKITIGNYATLTENTINTGTGFIGGTLSKWIAGSYTTAVPAGVDYPFGLTNSYGTIYQLLDASGKSRWMLVYPDASPATAGEVAVTYTDASTVTTGLTVADGSYSINNRYDGNWTLSNPNSNTSGTGAAITFAPNATTNTFRIGAYATGAYQANDGTSRLMNTSTALTGTHQDGTTTPFVFRTGIPFTSLTAAPIYVGASSSAIVSNAGAVTSAGTGSWTSAATWVGGVVPTACQPVIIASGHTVTVSGTAVAGNVTINNGGTLVNASGSFTVGCSGNNSFLMNNGTYTCNGGTVTVNGYVSHSSNSYFNHTGGDIIVDGNDNGNAATSVGFGGSIFKIETSNLNLTGGKITIVDPLVNSGTPISATSISQYTANTHSTTGIFNANVNAITASGANTISIASNTYGNMFGIGQFVSGNAAIPANTTITAVTQATGVNPPYILTLSNNVTAAIASGATLNFSTMQNNGATILLEANAVNTNLAVGQSVSGTGIQAGSIITEIKVNGLTASTAVCKITLSLPVTGLTTSPVTSQQTISIGAVNTGSYSTILSAANTSIVPGMIVAGTGLLEGTYVTEVTGSAIKLSQPIQAGAPTPLAMNFYPKNFEGSGAFVYDSPNHYAAGLNHTLQIGDGVSTQKGAVTTYGFNCVFQKYIIGGMLSLGNLIVDAPDGASRFMNSMTGLGNNNSCNMNVQGNFTIASGSVFKKYGANSTIYVGGNLVNNGSFLTAQNGVVLYMGNFINGVAVPATTAQSIGGSGTYATNLWALSNTVGKTTTHFNSLNVNNTSSGGVTLNIPVWSFSVTLTNGILYTSSANLLTIGTDTLTDTSTGSLGVGTFTSLDAAQSTYIDGPFQFSIITANSVGQVKSLPIGNGGVFMPALFSSAGGGKFRIEAINSNSGTTSANASNLAPRRWNFTRVSGDGATPSAFNLYLGAPGMTSSNFIVQSTSDQGVYDVVASTTPNFSATASINPVGPFLYTINSVSTPVSPQLTFTTAPAYTSYTGGYFSYAEGPACSGTPAPGNTVASVASVCSGAPTTLSLQNATTGTAVTYQWQISTDGGTTFTNISGATAATYVAYPAVDSSYKCFVSCSNGTPVASAPVAITLANTAIPTVTGTTVCNSGAASLSATVTGAGVLSWYDAATGGSVLTTGSTYVPTVSATTTYYVSSTTTAAATAGQTATPAGTGTSTANFKGLSFDATRAFKLNTVTVYPKNTAAGLTPITIRLYDNAGNQVSGTSDVVFTPTLNTGTANTTSQVVTLNYNVPVGTGYRLVAAFGMASANALGNSTATQTFPAPYSSFTITGNVSDLSSAPATAANAYNCFYNINIDEYCETVRVPVTATVINAPTFTTTAATCAAAGSTLVSNYNASLTYTFTPSGPSVGAGGVITGATAGTAYAVTAGNTDCTSTSASFTNAIQLVTPATPTFTTTAATCAAAGSTVVSNYNASLTYIFTPSGPSVGAGGVITGATAGTAYAVTAGNTNCTSTSASFTNAIVLPAPAAPTGNTAQALVGGVASDVTIEDIVVSGSNGNWYATQANALANTNPLPAGTILVSGATYYTVSVSVNGCVSATALAVTVSITLANESFEINNLSFYPNPVENQLHITANDVITKIEIFNIMGKQIKLIESNSNEMQADLSELSSSTYIIKVYSEQKVQTLKVIKK